jgi:superfamily II DNA or RNA helicase
VKLAINTPTIVRISEVAQPMVLTSDLRYKDRRAEYDYVRMRNSKYLRFQLGEEKFNEQLEKAKAAIHNTLLFEDDDGYYSYSGLIAKLSNKFGATVENNVSYPESRLIPWDHPPKFPLRDYQVTSVEKLLAHNHAAIELPTGSGKTRVIMQLLKQLGLHSVVVAPTTNIADQLRDDLIKHLGRKFVGQFYGGKKQIDKLFTVAIGASIIRVEKGSEAWNFFSGTKVFIGDEAHTLAADTLSYMCLEVFQNAPYRFFVSATQMRTDGLDLLLEAITGPVVYELTLRQLVDMGYLARPRFNMVQVPSNGVRVPKDPMKAIQQHLLYNPYVNKRCGELANKCVETGRSTLILVDEIEQFTTLLPHFRYEAKFAHGGVTKANAHKIPNQYHKCNPSDLVKEFNEGKFPILVGTSCVAVGTDFQNVGALFYLMGGTSEIQVSQAVGRGTRGGVNGQVYKQDGTKKTDFLFFDFDVDFCGDTDGELITHRHAMARKKIYDGLHGPVNIIKI